MTTEMRSAKLAEMQKQAHGNCVVCSPLNERGLGLEFTLTEDGSVKTVFNCDKDFEGYQDVLHGGIISSLIDGAMTNCMFAHGYIAVTAELNVRFQHPVVIGPPATVRAWIDKYYSPLYVVKAELLQNQEVKVTAVGKFMSCSS